MDVREAVRARHSVRKYKDTPIPDGLVDELNTLIRSCNEESGLHLQLILDDPECFNTLLNHYGWFSNVRHYIAVAGAKALPDLERGADITGRSLSLPPNRRGSTPAGSPEPIRRASAKRSCAKERSLSVSLPSAMEKTKGKSTSQKLFPGFALFRRMRCPDGSGTALRRP